MVNFVDGYQSFWKRLLNSTERSFESIVNLGRLFAKSKPGVGVNQFWFRKPGLPWWVGGSIVAFKADKILVNSEKNRMKV
jgi:hypothetical protein